MALSDHPCAANSPITANASSVHESQHSKENIPKPASLLWDEKLEPAKSFTYGWPQKGGGKIEESFDPAWKGVISLEGNKIRLKIGECLRERDRRKRRVVFFEQTAMCEFIQTPNHEWTSIIKPDGKKVLSLDEIAPPLYRGTRVISYREATGMQGIGIPKGAAVVIAKDDLESAVYHGAARWLGKKGFPILPSI